MTRAVFLVVDPTNATAAVASAAAGRTKKTSSPIDTIAASCAIVKFAAAVAVDAAATEISGDRRNIERCAIVKGDAVEKLGATSTDGDRKKINLGGMRKFDFE